MPYRSLKSTRLAEQVSEQIKDSIFQGRYRPGERIPTEHKLVEIFGVSRVIVREAVRSLELAGLIEIKRGPKGGAFVLPMRHEAVSQVMIDLLKLGKASASHILEVRLAIEPIVAELAATRATAQDMELLAQAVQGMPPGPSEEYVAQNVNFHRLLARCSQNPMYDILVNILMDFTEDLILKIKPADRIIHDTNSHAEIFARVRERDAAGTRQKMRSHLEDIVPIYMELEKTLHPDAGN
ncbi:MAG: FadR/GntR family transcriptional regulator [Thermodesulfobacteriota bacterium]